VAYPTTAARKFSQQAELEGIPVPRIEFGYVPDPLGASLNGVYAVYKLGKKIDWFIDLNQGDAPSQADIISA